MRVHKSPGSHGSVAFLDLELKTIAGVGLVGFPNAGKSSLLRCLSNARPKVADYPFTTVHPNIGTVEYSDGEQVSMADIPGLIGGASENRGMGHDFLRHIERTRLLVYVIDVSSYAEHRALGVKDPAAPPPSTQFELLRNELYKYSPTLLEKRHIVVANKMDVEGAAEGLAELEAGLKANAAAGDFAELYADVPGVGEGREAAPPPVYAISAKRGLEVGRLAKAIRREYESVCAEDEAAQDGEDDELMADGDYAGAAPPSFESGVKEYGVEVFYVGSGDLPPDVQQQLLDDPN
uniref:OBG-type G domain-containing protein n=1 Tax=Phaeomonas parva TaxID=124430 RepID=A0A7S1TXA2_9STRA